MSLVAKAKDLWSRDLLWRNEPMPVVGPPPAPLVRADISERDLLKQSRGLGKPSQGSG